MTTGYGTDLWCLASFSPSRLARGAVVVLQALYRRLITPRGVLLAPPNEDVSVEDDPTANTTPAPYGLDVAGYIGAVGTEVATAALPGLVRGELLKDDRVAEVSVEVTRTEQSNGEVALVIQIFVTLVDENTNFEFTVSADGLTLKLLDWAA